MTGFQRTVNSCLREVRDTIGLDFTTRISKVPTCVLRPQAVKARLCIPKGFHLRMRAARAPGKLET